MMLAVAACALLALPAALALDHSGWPVEVSGTRLTNSFGEDLGSTVSSNTALNVSSDLRNTGSAPQDISYIVQVKDGGGTVVQLGWLDNRLAPGGSGNMALSWTPEVPGQYAVEVFVWEDLEGQVPLAESGSVSVTVG